MNSSPQRGSFHIDCELKAVEEGTKTVEEAQQIIELYRGWHEKAKEVEDDPEWQKNNLEYDLRNAKWICDKAKAREEYAQHVYAALCNQDWQRNDVWPLLKGETYSCSWRYAGGIVADMREEGDYIDWYCSGIRGPDGGGSEVDTEMDAAALAQQLFVPEGTVTDEIREDFFKLGWIPVNNNDEI